MSNSRPASSSLSDTEQSAVRYYPVSNSCEVPVPSELGSGEVFVVPSFEVAEALIAYGADSARIAISQIDSSEENYPGYVQVASNKQLAPVIPFRVDQSILIVLPTYKERQNLEAMVETIGRYLVADILIVDDNSPTGTGQLVDQVSLEQKHVHVLHRTKKEGLGPAYLAGFQWALARGYQLIIEMDCDFSHSPWDLPDWFTGVGLPTWSSGVDMYRVEVRKAGAGAGALSRDLLIPTSVYFWVRVSVTGPEAFAVIGMSC